MVSGNNGDVFVVFNLFTKVDFLVVIGSKALSIFEDQFTSRKTRLSESGHLTFKSPQILRGVSTSPEPVSMENNDAVIQLFYFNSKSQM